ncbi:MAG: MFS transporter [Dehalococcoidia bacterium]|nr:MFS transporter [Dehalococcoidia bacterium]
MIGAWANRTFAALSNPHYRILWIGTTLAFLAYMMSSIAQSVVAFDLTGKNGAVGAVALGMGVAQMMVAPFGGVLADRVSKRKLLLFGQGTIATTFIAVGVLIITDAINLPVLIVSTFVMGIVFSFIAPARQAWIGDLLSKEDLANGVALQQVSMTGTRVFGPFLAALLLAVPFSGTGGTYLFMGGMITIVVVTLAQLPATPTKPRAAGASVAGDFMLGVRHMKERPRLMVLGLSFMAFVAFGFTYQFVLPGFLEHELGREPEDVTYLLGVGAVAGLVVTVGMASQVDSPRAWWYMIGGGVALGLALMATAVAGNFAAALVAMFVVGAGSGAFQMLNNSLTMQESDPAYYGRVMSITMLAWGLNGIAGYPFGLIADAAGERPTMMIMGIAVLATTVVTALVLRALPARPAAMPAASSLAPEPAPPTRTDIGTTR